MKFLINKVVIFTLKTETEIVALVEGIYKKNLILKIPIDVTYHDGKREPTAIECAIGNVKKAEKGTNTNTCVAIYTSGYSKKEFTYHMLPIENILKYELSKEDLISIISKDK